MEMENVVNKNNVFSTFLTFSSFVFVALALITIVYGIESVAPGAHDAFHDFRHSIGMACH